jgi:hypothetical protein
MNEARPRRRDRGHPPIEGRGRRETDFVEERSLKFVAEACARGDQLGAPGASVRNVCTDSRSAKPGDLFFALTGRKVRRA